MLLAEFASACHQFWGNYFEWILRLQREGRIENNGKVTLFPNMLICTQTKSHLLAELVGATKRYDGLILKQRNQESTAEYLAQFRDEGGEESLIHLDGSRNGFGNLCLSHEVDFADIESRFPALGLYKSRLVRAGSKSCLLSFGPNFRDASISNCILINTNGEYYRAKHVVEMLIVAKNINKAELNRTLTELVNRDSLVKGVVTCGSEFERDYVLASQLQSLFLTPHLHETTIGEFFNRHPEVICRALNVSSVVYEPFLEWREAADGNTDTAINPDMMIMGESGLFDILDFKTALLDRRSTTKGERKRRRFVDTVNEGIAQLANYVEYFQFEENRQHAKNKYGIEVGNPRLYLVVGYFDNSSRDEIEQALRPFKDVTVLDYDSLVQLFLAQATSTTMGNVAQPKTGELSA